MLCNSVGLQTSRAASYWPVSCPGCSELRAQSWSQSRNGGIGFSAGLSKTLSTSFTVYRLHIKSQLFLERFDVRLLNRAASPILPLKINKRLVFPGFGVAM